ncbi:L,D-transpeptidase [Sansalvadorimonas sp. 2012CJ34-2]|uniref:L,D-transpeptidase n=1 Tax=Parendozoicomonas callyspongiae TaxID=2942213 RepID=A0ABT0PEK4_9GAMM|nr:L,D-transpeptidase [Sansalvadorimonas sp. 2012CJ34-2]MCL6269804.1 L,D-transpeptidase [Sansalvadorimonas sp. 2012CJ34-2]
MPISVDITRQLLSFNNGDIHREWPVSTGLKGTGQESGSYQTPLGQHYIRACIGYGLAPRAVLQGRRTTGEVWTQDLHAQQPGRDWVLGRILWLCGCEPGFNRFGSVDTQRRYIYIHGTPDCEPLGVPLSHGCIRMNCDDVVELFPLAGYGTKVNIHL